MSCHWPLSRAYLEGSGKILETGCFANAVAPQVLGLLVLGELNTGKAWIAPEAST